MQKLITVTLFLMLVSACSTSHRGDHINDKPCKRYVPMTEANFTVVLIFAMTEKAYAGYSLGYSELVILQTLKDDFKFWYFNHAIGDTRNSALDMGMSCNRAAILSNTNDDNFNSTFHDLALSSMKEGQKKMIKYPASKVYAEKIIDEHPLDAIKNADKKYREELKWINEIEKKMKK